MCKVCLKYGLYGHVKDILNGKIISNAAWTYLVNSAIMKWENTMWSISICLYSSLRLYRRVIPMIGLCHCWQLADSKQQLRQCSQSVVQVIRGGCEYHSRNSKVMFNKCILSGSEDSVDHFLEFCMGINDQRVALITSVNRFLNSNDFNSLSIKDRWLFILTDAGYNEITK